MPVFTQNEPRAKTTEELVLYVGELVTYLGYVLENLDEENIPSLRRRGSRTLTVAASDWKGQSAPYTATLSDSRITPSGIFALSPPEDVTDAELEAYRRVDIFGGRQQRGKLTLCARGAKPTENIRVCLTCL